MSWRGIALAPSPDGGSNIVWVSLAVVVGMVALGVGLRRRTVRSAGIDVGAVSEQWMAENKADKHQGFM